MVNTWKIIGSFILFGLLSNIHVRGQECVSPLGMEDGRIKDSQITASSVIKRKTPPYAWVARLNRNIPAWGAWCPDVTGGKIFEKNYDQYIQIDLLNLTKITRIATQGRSYSGGQQYARDYKISYRRDGGGWDFYQGKDQTVKIFKGNNDVSTVVRHDLEPVIMARYIKVHPGYYTGNQPCMRLELYGCVPTVEKDILSYSMPVGHTTKNGKVSYKDTSYNGVINNGVYRGGTGILTDGKFGRDDAKEKGHEGEGWVGWYQELTTLPYIDIIFEFSGVIKFRDVALAVNVDTRRDHAVFNKSELFFALTNDGFSDTSVLQFCPEIFPDRDAPYSTNVTLPLCEYTARFIKLRLYFGGRWLLITEITFNSVPVSKDNEKKTGFLNCQGSSCSKKSPSTTQIYNASSTVSVSLVTTPKKNIAKTCDSEEAINSTAMFFVGVAATLAVVLVVFGLIWFIKRRQASKMYTDVVEVDTVELKNETAVRPSVFPTILEQST